MKGVGFGFEDFHGFSWIFMDFHGFSWIFIDFHGFSVVLPCKSQALVLTNFALGAVQETEVGG